MPYDPSFPPDHQELDGAPFRDQFNGLNDLITARAPRVDGVADLSVAVNDPPQQAEVLAIVAKLNELLAALRQP